MDTAQRTPRDFSTVELARICRVSYQTIISCAEAGMIEYYLLPGSKFRRFTRAAVQKFLAENSLSTDESDSMRQVMLFVEDHDMENSIISELENEGIQVMRPANDFDAGMMLSEHVPDAAIIDRRKKGADAILQNWKEHGECASMAVIVISDRSKKKVGRWDDWFLHPVDIRLVTARLATLCGWNT